ncbi:DMT family transporter [Thiomicrorhabdus aquaedulcis]|uniref:DMT family transporter n=1 Tax=Thiomicrorhabdus aquaedulcis TaxID=2211106 RepID=UPI001562730F|nr:DMT family transporter [Thiomicrorhabdus aquaedulcis]
MHILLAYFGVIAIWTTTPLAIQWSGQVDWFFGIAIRLGLSALLILPLAFWLSGRPMSFGWPALKVYGAASIGLLGGMTPVYWAAQTMPSGWIALIWGMTPIATGILIFFLLGQERLTLNKWLGILVSVLGLVVLFAPNLHSEHAALQITGLLVALVGVFFHSLSTVLVKKSQHDLPPLHVVTGALWITTLVFLVVQPSAFFNWSLLPTLPLKTSLAIGYLVVIGSVLGFVLYYYVLKHMDALRLGMIPMITPLFAILLGYFANQEQLNLSILLGAGLVILGLGLFELNTLYRYYQRHKAKTL